MRICTQSPSTPSWSLERESSNYKGSNLRAKLGKIQKTKGHKLLQGIFPTQGSNPGLLHYRQILYQLSHKGSPRILEWVAYPFSSRSPWPRNSTRVSHIAGRFFTNWAIRKVPPKQIYTQQQLNREQGLSKQDSATGKVRWVGGEARNTMESGLQY